MPFTVDPQNFELKSFLEHISKFKREKGIPSKELNVAFEKLSITGKNSAASTVQDVPSFLFPLWFKVKEMFTHDNRKNKLSHLKRTRSIIKDVSGYAQAGTMTLVIGRPGAGCTTFLKAITGQTQTYTAVEGNITYGGINSHDMSKNYPEELIYVPEVDDHFPYLTVEQTLRFAIASKIPQVRIDDASPENYISTMEKMLTTILGLEHVEGTNVGNDFIRGVSGGERKRVSIAEALATNGSVYCYDNSTRGLDSSTALKFTKALQTWTRITKMTCFMTAYQASENIFNLFDQVLILYSGREVYMGSRAGAVQYFIDLGFEKGARVSSSEFLTAVTDPFQRIARAGYETKVPSTVEEFVTCWHESKEFFEIQAVLSKVKKSTDDDATKQMLNISYMKERNSASNQSNYSISYWQQLNLCCKRSFQNVLNNRAYEIIQAIVSIIQALITGSLYFNIPDTTAGIFSRCGACFFSLLYFVIMSLAEASAHFSNRPIFNKQRGYTMYHPSADILATRIVQIPIRFVTILLFSVIVYFLAGMKNQAGAFFIFLLFINLTAECINAIFMVECSLTSTVSALNAIAGVTMVMMILYTSFMIQRPSMHWWFRWFSYINPLLYGFEASVTSNFHGDMMSCGEAQIIPTGKDYANVSANNKACAVVGAALTRKQYPNTPLSVNGDIYLKIAYEYSYTHVWRNLGILIGLLVALVILNAVIVELYTPVVPSADKLLLIRGSKVPASILELEQLNTNEDISSDEDLENSEKEYPKPTALISQNYSEFHHMYNRIKALRELHHQDYSASDQLGSDSVFAWRNVNYSVPYGGTTKQLLKDMEGYILPGTLTALMGESGAGKTTLLNALSQRTDIGIVTGNFLVNGKSLDSSFTRMIGYVQQQDLHISKLTVRESLLFAARLRRPLSVPDEEKVAYVEKVIRILHMDDYEDAIAGEPGHGLNVEQRKKLSIATELVAKPTLLLLLDEPTSGLDSQSAWSIIELLRELADAGQAILCTIHQPSSTLFQQFDRLLLLKRGGKMAYFGDIGANASTVIRYFESHGARQCLPNENCAEYMLEVVGQDENEKDWSEIWHRTKDYQMMQGKLDQVIGQAIQRNRFEGDSTPIKGKFATPYYYQLMYVFKRTWTQSSRDLNYFLAKLFLSIVAGLIHGFSFWDIKHTAVGMQNAIFATFMPLMIASPLSNQIQSHAIESRELFEVRESRSNTFHWSTLLISQLLCEIPYAILISTFYFICFYFPIKMPLNASVAGFWWLIYCVFFQLYYVSFALAIVYLSGSLPTANVLVGVLLSFCISFCGVMQPPSFLPHFWKFMWRVSPYTYFVESIASTYLHNRKVACSASEMNYLDPPDGLTCGQYLKSFFANNNGYTANPNATEHCGICPYSVGDEYLKTIEMFYSHRSRNIGIFVAYIGFNICAMVFGYWAFRVRHWNPFTSVKGLFSSKSH